MFALLRTCALAAVVVMIGSAPIAAHEGHDHDEPAPAASAVSAAPRAEAASDNFELVAVAREGHIDIYLDRLASNEPVSGATITVDTSTGSVVAAPAKEDGTYALPAPWAQQPGRHELIFTVVAGDQADVLTATLDVTEDSAPEGAHASPFDRFLHEISTSAFPLNGTLVAIALVAGLVIGAGLTRWSARGTAKVLALAAALLISAPDTRAHEGEEHGEADPATHLSHKQDLARRAPDGSLFVPKPTQRILAIRTAVTAQASYRRTIELPGRIIPDPNASGYVQTSVGGRLSPPEGGFPRLGTRVAKGDVLAYVTPPIQAIDVSDMRQRQGELDQQISIVERRIARYEQLAQRGAVTQVQLDEAKLELQGLNDRRAALDRTRREPEALAAPVSGMVAEINATAGQMAQPNVVLFQIVEPSRLWVEALSFDPLSGARNATAKTGTGRSLEVSYQGAGFAARSQAVPVHFRVEGDAGGLRPGQFVTVFAEIDEERSGIALPRASVVRTQSGQDLVFEHVSAERFVARPVRVEPLDGARVLVVSGIAAATRVVTQGAELLDQVR